MITLPLTTLAAAVGGLALSLTAGAGVAFGDPVIDSTCNYSQVVAAMNDQFPQVGAQFNASPLAQAWLQNFLNSPPAQRQQLLQQVQGTPDVAQYGDILVPLAKTCSKY